MSREHEETTCTAAREQFAMLLYGELSFDVEERVESHLDGCAACRLALQREQAFHAALETAKIGSSPSLLQECREELRARLSDRHPAQEPSTAGWWDQFTDIFGWRPSAGVLRPVGALTLVAAGFLGAELMPALESAWNRGWHGGGSAAYQAMGIAESPAERVRYVEPASNGRVQIVLDETRQRLVSGRLDDAHIRALLIGAAKDPSDPGLRAETVAILNSRARSADVRDALVYALRHDQNAGVRLKAMDGLKPFVQDPEVRGAFSQVLLTDANPGLRTQAIDLLTTGVTPNADRQIVGTLQELMQRGEPQGYVRERCRRVLQAMNASAESY